MAVSEGQYVKILEADFDLDLLSVPIDWLQHPLWISSGPEPLIARAGVLLSVDGPVLIVCLNCNRSLCRGQIPKLSLANHIFLGQIPMELEGLSVVEECMVTLTHLRCLIIQLKEDNAQSTNFSSQRAYMGHTHDLLQPTHERSCSLPPPPPRSTRLSSSFVFCL